MPRLDQSLIYKARKISPFLPLLLRTTRTLPSAVNELRWLKEYVEHFSPRLCELKLRQKLLKLVKKRARGVPLQYILGSQPFGDLDIRCKSGVLIPRPETEAYTLHLAKLIIDNQLHPSITKIFTQNSLIRKIGGRQTEPRLRILDACSGSGAISLLLNSVLCKSSRPEPRVFIRGIDICPKAIALAFQNRTLNEKLGHLRPHSEGRIDFEKRDIFEPYHLKWDIIVSNPPYISPNQFDNETKRSVRNFEPKLALVPKVPKLTFGYRGNAEDIFYRRLVDLHDEAFSKVLLMEVGDAAQAVRVVEIINDNISVRERNRVQFWRDSPDGKSEDGQLKMVNISGIIVQVKGVGRIRSVILIRKDDAIPRTGKEILIKHIRLQDIFKPAIENPQKREIYGPPELKSTWKKLNSPISTDGRATRAMGRGWGSQTKAREEIENRECLRLEREAEIKRQNWECMLEIERPLLTKRALRKKGKFTPESEPFLFRHFR